VDALKFVVKSVICGITTSLGVNVATWRRDGGCRDLAMDKAVQLKIITHPLAGRNESVVIV